MLNAFDTTITDNSPLEGQRAIQSELLRRHLGYCQHQSPYYRRLLRDIDLKSWHIAELARLPLTGKEEFSKYNEDFIAVEAADMADIVYSSGTTGKPCKIVYSAADLRRLAYNEKQAFRRFGITEYDRVLLTCTIDRCFVAGLAYFLGSRVLGAATVRNGLNSLASHAAVIEDLAPTVIVGVPSFLRKLGRFMAENNRTTAAVKRLICIGEPIRKADLSATAETTELESLWQAQAFSTYASSETITTFAECEEGCGGHFSPELGIVEIISDSGQSLPPGAVGEVVVTPLQITGTPLLRFKTGDISFIIDEPCRCGRPGPRLGPILGRKSQMLKIKGTTVFAQMIFSALAAMRDIDEYFIEVSGSSLADEVEIFVVPQSDRVDLSQISAQIQAITRVALKVTAVDRQKAMARIFAADNRKPVRFFDLRTPCN